MMASVGMGFLAYERIQLRRRAGETYEEFKFSYGQCLAALIWLPVLFEYAYHMRCKRAAPLRIYIVRKKKKYQLTNKPIKSRNLKGFGEPATNRLHHCSTTYISRQWVSTRVWKAWIWGGARVRASLWPRKQSNPTPWSRQSQVDVSGLNLHFVGWCSWFCYRDWIRAADLAGHCIELIAASPVSCFTLV